MHIIKLDAIGSTNAYLKELMTEKELSDYTIVVAKHQTEGRGQMGTSWHVEKGKNLTFSVLKKMRTTRVEDSFYMSMMVSIAIVKTLQAFNVPKLAIKWPNDILSEEKKICGILIENVIKQTRIDASVIGVGLNVNQRNFEGLPQASSLLKITGVPYNLDELLVHIIAQLQDLFKQFDNGHRASLKHEYESLLFRKNKPSTFSYSDRTTFPGIIKGVDRDGHLQVLVEDDIIKTFAMKEVRLLY